MQLRETERSALKSFRGAIEEALAGKLWDVILFGSKARGDAREDSDIDLLVVVDSHDWRVCDKVYEAATDVLLDTEVCLSPKVISKADYDRMRKDEAPFITNVIREGIAV